MRRLLPARLPHLSKLWIPLWMPLCILLGAEAPAHAQVADQDVRAFVIKQMDAVAGASRVEVSVGDGDRRLHLAACERTELFLRSNTRLWGRTYVGARCAAGAHWSINVPVQVSVFGPALVAARTLPAGQTIDESAVRVEEVEWTRTLHGVVQNPADLSQRAPVRTIEAGEPIAVDVLREVPAIVQGDPVKLIGQGAGFSIATDAVALASAPDGQPVRVRTDAGKIVTGTARAGRIVEVSF